MADEAQEQAPEKSGGFGKIAIIAVLLAAVAGGGFFAWQRMQAEPAEEMTSEETEAQKEIREAEQRAQRLVPLEPLVVNLGGSGAPRYLKVQVELEVGDVGSKGAVEASVPVVRDALIVLLGSQRLTDLQEFEGKVLLKEEILDRVNGALGEPLIDSVFFTEFIVQ